MNFLGHTCGGYSCVALNDKKLNHVSKITNGSLKHNSNQYENVLQIMDQIEFCLKSSF